MRSGRSGALGSARMWVAGLKDAFFNWRIHPDDAWVLGFYDEAEHRFGRCDFAPFGHSVAPGINDVATKVILRRLQGVHRIVVNDFVDDLFGVDADTERAW